MTPSTIDNTATALRLAARGVTVSGLAAACGISRPSAHAILRRLVEIGELLRKGGVGRGGHVYYGRYANPAILAGILGGFEPSPDLVSYCDEEVGTG